MDATTAKLETPTTLQAAIEFFSDPDRCHAYIVQNRWPDGVVICPICNQPNPRYLAKQRRFECRKKHPRRQFSVKVGTIFEDSPIALKSWALAVWEIANCKNGISSYELARALGVTQKTAWFMNHRIRLAMQGEDGGTAGGEVEVDETYIGGKARKMNTGRRKAMLGDKHKRNAWAGKVAVLGLLERHTGNGKSRVRTMRIDSIRRHRLQPIVTQHVEDGSTVYTRQAPQLQPARDLLPAQGDRPRRSICRWRRSHERAGELLVPAEASDSRDVCQR
jgi:transposase-like protein